MDDHESRYRVGALLYSPALNDTIASAIAGGQFGKGYSVALCLEDTIDEAAIGRALAQLEKTFATLHAARSSMSTAMPKVFVRVRNPGQVREVFRLLRPHVDLLSGFIFPKYSTESADLYNEAFLGVAEVSPTRLHMMPILESEDIIDLASRPAILGSLKQKIDSMREHVLNVRVGGNDFSNVFGLRRHVDETIYDMLPVARLLCDILTVFSRDYVVSGPVWEYYDDTNDEWEKGLRKELELDVLNGFIGKTVIHPKQIPAVVEALKVSRRDYDDARDILSWHPGNGLLVGGSTRKERMNEVKTHGRWARRMVTLGDIYGVRDE